jgi:L-xylulokinase
MGIDNGTTMLKAAVFTTDGKELGTAARKIEMIEPNPGWHENDPNTTWANLGVIVKEVLSETAINPADIACVAITGHGNGLYLIDADGNPVRNGVIASDSRASDTIAAWTEAGIGEKVLPMTTQCLWPGQPNALLAWVRDHEPEVFEKATAYQCAKDYLRTRLTGEINLELTDTSGCSLMNVATGTYDDAVLELFGIMDVKHLLPPLVQTHDITGTVTAAAAAHTGLKEGTPVAGGMFDIDACGLASGILNEEPMSLVAGTWGNNQYIAREPLVDKDLFMTSCYSMPGWYLMLEGSPTSASNLEWFVTEFMAAERTQAEAQGTSVYDIANDLAFSVSPEETTISFLPFLYGSNAGAGLKATFAGLESSHTRAHVIRAIYEGIVFGHNTHLERLCNFRPRPGVIRFTGGAARSERWVQLFADCFQLPIEIPAGTELGALGAAIAAGVACGTFSSYEEAVRAMSSIARRQDPDPGRAGIYAEKYGRYQELIAKLR